MKTLFAVILLTISMNAYCIPHSVTPQKLSPSVSEYVTEIVEVMTDRLSRKDLAICTIRANVAEDSLANARAGVSLKKGKAALIAVIMTSNFEKLKLPTHEVYGLVDIVDLAFLVHMKYPHVLPTQLGNKIWNDCVYIKSAIIAKL